MEQKHILLIEDEIDLSESLQQFLIETGYRVHVVHTSEEGLRFMLSNQTDLILLDIMTHSIHGATFVERVREMAEDKKDTKVLVLTNLDNDISRDKFEGLGISGYLVKAESSLDDIALEIKKILEVPAEHTGAPAE